MERADLRSAFVDAKAVAKLEADRDRLKGEVEKFRTGKEKEITKLDEELKKANSTAVSEDPAYEKCPLTGKPLDATKKSVYQGKTIVFCCNNCKGKFDKDPSAHKAKLKDFKPSDAFHQGQGKTGFRQG